jgi:hypothetical protein
VLVGVPVCSGNVLAKHCTVTSDGQFINGGVLSSTKMIWLQVDVFPHASVVFQVRMIVFSWGQEPGVITSVDVIKNVEQLSVADAVPVVAGSVLAVHSIVTFAGQVVCGEVVSSTVIVWLHEFTFPHASVAFQLRIMVRSCGQSPGRIASVKVIARVEQLSVAVADPVVAGSVLAVHWMVTLTGHIIEGAVLSSTVMTWRQVLKLLHASVAFHVRFIILSCGHAPATVTSVKVIANVEQLSVAVDEPVFAGKVPEVHSIVTFAGHDMAGAVLSCIVMTWLHVLKFPHASVAFHVRVMIFSWGQIPVTMTSVDVIPNVEQLSVADALPVFAGKVLAAQSMVTFTGQVIVGGAVSSTVMIWLHVEKLPQASCAFHDRVIVFRCGQLPVTTTSVDVMAKVEQLSVAVAEPVLAGRVLAVHCIVTLAGHDTVGAIRSFTVMIWLHVLELPQASVAFHLRVIILSCGHAPATTTSVDEITAVEQLSAPVAVPVLAGNELAVHEIVTFTGQVTDGATLSATVMLCIQFTELPHSSVAFHVREME